MTDERGDLKNAFLAVFEAEDKNLFKSQEKAAKKAFIMDALYEYRNRKMWIERIQKEGDSKQKKSALFCYRITDEFITIVYATRKLSVDLQTSKDSVMIAAVLGQVLGRVLAIVRFGLTNHLFDPLIKHIHTEQSMGAEVLASTSKIVTEMRNWNKKIKPQFVARQISLIAKENAGKLTKEQQELLIKVAAMFASI